MTIIYFSIGNDSFHMQTIFSVLSYFAYNKEANNEVLIYTDKVTFFNPYLSKYSKLKLYILSNDELVKFKGEIDFVLRVKIALLENTLKQTNNNVLFIDSDTYFINSLHSIKQTISHSTSILHLKEFNFNDIDENNTFKTTSALIKAIKNKQVLHNKNAININFNSWNSGVIGMHAQHLPLFDDIYALTDLFYKASAHHASEQFAFSYILEKKTTIEACDNIIFHYWPSLKKEITTIFLKKKLSLLQKFPIEKQLEVVKEWTIYLPTYIDNHELVLKGNALRSFRSGNIKNGIKWFVKASLKGAIFDFTFIKQILTQKQKKQSLSK